jgi:hypothetical protein
MTPKLSIFAEGLDHPEGVAVHPDGSVWCGGERSAQRLCRNPSSRAESGTKE